MVSGLERTGVGFTVIVKVSDGPAQSTEPLLNDGDTVIVAFMGEVPVFVAVNVRGPVPSVPRPIAVFVFVHEKVVSPLVFTVVIQHFDLFRCRESYLPGHRPVPRD